MTYIRNFLKRECDDLKSPDLWRAMCAEWLGLTFVTLFATGTGLYHKENPSSAPSSVNIALEAGFMIGCLVTVFGTISGGHVNPSITMGFAVTREITLVRSVLYIAAQSFGGICGAGLLYVLTPPGMHHGSLGLIMPGKDVTDMQALGAEAVIGFFLLFGTFAVIDKGRNDLQGSVPLMIGLMVSINVFFAFNISGGCMNPARNFGPAVITGKLDKIWLYWAGPLVGGAFGALLYDKIFSTKACRWCLGGCGPFPSPGDEENKGNEKKEESNVTEFRTEEMKDNVYGNRPEFRTVEMKDNVYGNRPEFRTVEMTDNVYGNGPSDKIETIRL
ncbi:lens fiber major intrinsic protein-like [Mizuhopecten yessoensis]|uniref:Aquaporin-4 n=1 Tax=Mizuhopecten yessoensis TaxID=6573 RepID=A0A210QJ41_MIZYE|nr:lens fiber major intrinsic protein-like [Mizuhopecten yessoensis]OWF48706.1 Aquaporin-4 [Mizuhopecten yessoensis]